MAKGESIINEAELELPEEIIQHIQYYLNGKEAAQTTLLAKSWYAAWLTRPNLDFDQDDFESISHYITTTQSTQSSETRFRFWKYMKKTVKRYETHNLKIDSLKLWIHGSYHTKNYSNSLKKLIMKASKMGATGLDFKIHRPYNEFTLPHEVFGSKNLVKLSVSGCKIGKVSCSRLKSLVLTSINNVDTLFSNDFSSKFPCLKDLTLHACGCYKEIQVSSPSLECMSFIQDKKKILRAKFDVPSIRKFTFSADRIPSVSFKTTSTNWRSDIYIKCHHSPSAAWILEMNKLLTELSQSKVSLFLLLEVWYRPYRGEYNCPKDIKVLCKPEVENLIIDDYSKSSSDFLDALVWCCRPTYVTHDWFPFSNCDSMDIVYKKLMKYFGLECSSASQSQKVTKHVGLKCSSASQSGSVCDLEEVDVEFFDEVVSAWRPRSVDDSTCPGADQQRIRLHLKWTS